MRDTLLRAICFNTLKAEHNNIVKSKTRKSYWLAGVTVPVIGIVVWSNIGPNADIGRFPVQVHGDRSAFQELALQLESHPFANKFSIRWQEIYMQGGTGEYEIQYNHLAKTLNYMSYATQRNPILACQGVRESFIHLVVSNKDVASGNMDWIVALNRNGCACQNKQEQIP